jgi:hypothetical protein
MPIARRARDLGQRRGADSRISAARPRTAGDRAGMQNRQFIDGLVERFRH